MTVQAGLCQTWSETPKTGFHYFISKPPSMKVRHETMPSTKHCISLLEVLPYWGRMGTCSAKVHVFHYVRLKRHLFLREKGLNDPFLFRNFKLFRSSRNLYFSSICSESLPPPFPILYIAAYTTFIYGYHPGAGIKYDGDFLKS